MARHVLIVPDKFKGTLTAEQAASAMEAGWHKAHPGDEVRRLPMSDGGDGFGHILGHSMGAEPVTVSTVDAAHRPCEVTWWHETSSGLAVIESASVIGLAMLPPGKYHPFELDTTGLGQVMAHAAQTGARRCLVGIGGSATNDAGMGMARALGWQFQNKHGLGIDRWTDLHTLDQIHQPDTPHPFEEVLVAVDVTNPLLGPQGCSRIYGPQKGLREEDFAFSERCLETLANVMTHHGHTDHRETAGAGAAGGLGYGLLTFTQATLKRGFDLFATYSGFHKQLEWADLVLTAEGAMDDQTLMGKGVGEVAQSCRDHDIPCLAFAGSIKADREAAKSLFQSMHALAPDLVTLEEAMDQPARHLESLVQQAAGKD